MDDFLVVLFYLGGLLLIGLAKSISKSGKKKSPSPDSFFKPAAEVSEDDSLDTYSPFSSFEEKSAVQSVAIGDAFIAETFPYETSYHIADNEANNDNNNRQTQSSRRDEEFILGDFDLRAAIIYSEIFKRPEY